MSEKVENKMNARRILEGLAHIGYTTVSAICDIVDNAISAKANNVIVKIKTKSTSKKNNLEEIRIIDNGQGMNEKGLINCLTLGSSDENYSKDSLSKFGLGLKSAGLSLGTRIVVISKAKGVSDFKKVTLDLEQIERDYFIRIENIKRGEMEDIDGFDHGTCIIIENLKRSFSTCKSIFKDLDYEMSETYYPLLKKNKLEIKLVSFSNKKVSSEEIVKYFDPLFEEECNKNGDLNPESWDGKSPRWLLKRKAVQVQEGLNPIHVTCTNLVHPPSFILEGEYKQSEARKRYRIAAGRNKFYIYRNGRLISRDYLGIFTRDQDLWSIRGKIEIETEHDKILMLDVKKSGIHFTEDTLEKIEDSVMGYKKASKEAWSKRKRKENNRENQDKNSEIKEKALESMSPYEKPSLVQSIDKIEEKEKIIEEKLKRNNEEVLTGPEKKETSSDNNLAHQKKGKIGYVDALEHDQLYSPYFVQDEFRVNISKAHRFQIFLSEYISETPNEVQTAIEILFLCLSYAEASVSQNFKTCRLESPEETSRLVLEVLEEFRHDFSTQFSKNLKILHKEIEKNCD